MPPNKDRQKDPRFAFVLKGYPRLSETFIAQEILALERRGMDLLIVSLRHPTDEKRHPIHQEIQAPVLYLPEYPMHETERVIAAWHHVRALPGYEAAKTQWLLDCRRDPSLPRFNAFPQALVFAAEAPDSIGHFHSHYLHWPASVTWYAALIRGLPWTCSAHARDIWTAPNWDKQNKLAALDWLVTCTAHGCRHLKGLSRNPDTVDLVYHGLDLNRFPAPPETRPHRDGSNPDDPVLFLSVGRAVQKKGYHYLLQALADLPPELHWRFQHIGYGPLLPALQNQGKDLGLGDRIDWLGAKSQDEVITHYRQADLFVLANCVAGDGDMDGLPNVMMEAQSQKLPCLSTNLSGIPELIDHRKTGLLVPPDDPKALAEALLELCQDPGLRTNLAAQGFRKLHDQFSHDHGIDVLSEKFGLTPRPIIQQA